MGYFNYHAKIRRLIREGHLVKYAYMAKWRQIAPALVMYFDCSPPMPVREHRFKEYAELLKEWERQKGGQ